MKKFRLVLLLLVVGVLVVSCATTEFAFENDTVRPTQSGMVQGIRDTDHGGLAWLGVPYAAPPVGALRWRAPVDHKPWEGVRETTAFASMCMQSKDGAIVGSEDCLYVNIWRPDTMEADLPVLVFAHGGGNRTGSGQDFPGDRLAKQANIIVVSVNYRLGPLGWFRHPAIQTGDPLDDSGNYGLLDIMQSLAWVRDNIRSFGGDPKNVTVSGQSAGGRDVAALLISPQAEGLFHKAIVFSGGMTLSAPEDGTAAAIAAVDAHLGEVQDLRAVAATELIGMFAPSPIKMSPFPHLFRDGHVIPSEGFAAVAAGNAIDVPVLFGSTRDEFSAFAFSDPVFISAVMSGEIFSDEDLLRQFNHSKVFGSRLYATFNAETPASLLAASPRREPIYCYRFAWGTRPGVTAPSVLMLIGAPHGGDMDFVTGHEDSPINLFFPGAYYTDENKPGRDALHRAMATYIGNFLRYGDPNGDSSTERTLPTWDTFTPDAGSAGVLRLDADAEQTHIEMVAADSQAAILSEMEAAVSAEDREMIIQRVFDDRFFWHTERNHEQGTAEAKPILPSRRGYRVGLHHLRRDERRGESGTDVCPAVYGSQHGHLGPPPGL